MIRWRKLTSKASTFLKLTYYDINHSDTTRLDFSAHGPAGYGRSFDSTLEWRRGSSAYFCMHAFHFQFSS